MQTTLLGYLLDALDEEDIRRVEELANTDVTIQQQLDQLSLALLPLGNREQHDEPPPGLAVRTCELIRIVRRSSL